LVTAAHGGKPPAFGGEGLPPAAEVVAEMRRIYEEIAVPKFLDDAAVQLLTEARETFDSLGLRHSCLARHRDEIMFFPWVGEQAQMAFILALKAHDVPATSHGISILVKSQNEHLLESALQTLADEPVPDPIALARLVSDMKRAKYDGYLGDDLLARCYSSERIDAAYVPTIANDLLKHVPVS
jgi:ATP-dependent helicase Lhr and Lhr-like helicase